MHVPGMILALSHAFRRRVGVAALNRVRTGGHGQACLTHPLLCLSRPAAGLTAPEVDSSLAETTLTVEALRK